MSRLCNQSCGLVSYYIIMGTIVYTRGTIETTCVISWDSEMWLCNSHTGKLQVGYTERNKQ